MLELLLNWKTISSISVSFGGLVFAIYKFVQLRKFKVDERLLTLEKDNAVENTRIEDLSKEVERLRDSLDRLNNLLLSWLKPEGKE